MTMWTPRDWEEVKGRGRAVVGMWLAPLLPLVANNAYALVPWCVNGWPDWDPKKADMGLQYDQVDPRDPGLHPGLCHVWQQILPVGTHTSMCARL